ncbi:pilus assembly protein CpaE [Nocardioides koreensis]
MVDLETARALRQAGVVWTPAKGDRFAVPDRDLDDEVFVVSDMVIETVDVPHGPRILAFNGTTEWALDSLEAGEALWLPREDQLRDLLGDAFVSLEQLPGPASGWAVTVDADGEPSRHVDVDAEAAYVRAVLAVLSA